MKLWSLEVKGKLLDVALRTRDDVREWAARRMMASGDYQEICDAYFQHERRMRLWGMVQANHPTARIVRVNVRRADSARGDSNG